MEKGEIIGRGARAVVYALPDGRALKLYQPTADPEFAKYVEREAWLGRVVYGAGVASPRVYETIIEDGAPGIIFERIEGREMADELLEHPEQVRALAARMAELHADVHSKKVPGLQSGLDGLRESLRRLAVPAEFSDLGDIVAAALQALAGLKDGDRLCHGDFHPRNIMMSPRGPVIIDWTSACLCAPVADVARTALTLKTAPAFIPVEVADRATLEALMDAMLDAYLRRYDELLPLDRSELAAWELPLAVARIGENFPHEYSWLKPIIRSHLV